jgi:hypothetical protein
MTQRRITKQLHSICSNAMQLKAVTAVNPASHCEFDRGKSDGAAAAAARVFADKHPNVT